MENDSTNLKYEVNASLELSQESADVVRDFLLREQSINNESIRSFFHLTVYRSDVRMPGLVQSYGTVDIHVDVLETRFMVLKPGGEVPNANFVPNDGLIGIRLTKRNQAIQEIQRLRSSLYRFENRKLLGNRKPTTAWRSAYGSKRYQPHVTLLNANSGLPAQFSHIGERFRNEVSTIIFDRYRVRSN